jgi:putative DNA primase/helicase
MHYTPEHAREALQYIDPGQDRHGWVRTLAAAKAAGLDLDDVCAWSAAAPNFKSERDVSDAWRSIDPSGSVQAGTLFHMARQGGWKPAQSERRSPPVRVQAQTRREPPRPAIRPGMSACEVWDAAGPATNAHPYIARKGGRPDGLRVCAGGLHVGGHDMTGALLVPVLTLAGELVSLQCIPAEGPKMNLPGHPMRGVFVVGELQPDGRAFVVEGIGQAWACWRATGCAAVVAFGWGRVSAVTGELKAAHPGLSVVLVPDAGKEREAERIAKAAGVQWVAMPDGSPRNFDANDYAAEHGAEALAALLESQEGPRRFKVLAADDLASLPPLQWLVRGVLPRHGVACLFGPSGSGKSFLAIDLAAHVAWGRDWFGHRVDAAPVAYLALEGEHGIAQRVQAWKTHHGALPSSLRFVAQPFSLLEDTQELAGDLTACGMAGGVVIIDTLNRAAPLVDENAAADMGRVIDGAKALQAALGGLVLLVHHSGKDTTRGMRGHSSLHAALDAAIEVTRNDAGRSWKLAKAKDATDDEAQPFRLVVETLGTDDFGDEVTSCVVEPDECAAQVQAVKLPAGGNQRLVLDALKPLLKASREFGKGGAPAMRPCVLLEEALPILGDALAVEPKRRTERARQAVTGLASRGVVGIGEGWVWLT